MPMPTVVFRGNPFTPDYVAIQIEGGVLCTCSDVAMGSAASFAAFYTFGLEYLSNLPITYWTYASVSYYLPNFAYVGIRWLNVKV